MKSQRQTGGPQVVVITGASAGVGRATTQKFARKGARIGLLARDRARLDAARREAEDLGGEGLVCTCDVADPDAVEAAAGEVEARFGPIDVWINNAMVSVYSPVIEMKPEEFRRVTDVTYLGYVWGTLAALRRMRPRNRGVVVQVGSALAYRGIPLQSAYCAAKHAIRGFNDSLRAELLHEKSKVRICMVQMPALNTPQFIWTRSRLRNKAQPVPPIFQPEVAADAIVHAATHRRREIYVGMPTVKAIIANKIAPGLLDRFLGKTAFAAQQTTQPADPHQRDNLMSPVPGNFAGHGPFDDRSRRFSPQLWATKHRAALWTIAFLGLIAGCLSRRRNPGVL